MNYNMRIFIIHGFIQKFGKSLNSIMIFIITMIDEKLYSGLHKVMLHWGFRETAASIYALLVMENRPMTAKEIADKIGRAYSSVINELNTLRRYGLVDRRRVDRKCIYTAVTDLVEIIKNERRRVMKFFKEIKEGIDDRDEYKKIIENVEKAIEYLGKIEEEV